MPILAATPKPAQPTAAEVRRVMAAQQARLAPSTWDRFVKSLAANGFQLPVQ